MEIIPVLDLLNGVVVRGIAGKRDQYQPIESDIAPSADPVDVARAIRAAFDLHSFYLADLDAILDDAPNHDLYRQLAAENFDFIVDAGLRTAADADVALSAGANGVIAGLETWPLLSSLEILVRRIGSERLSFSLDLIEGAAVRSLSDLNSTDPFEIGAAVLESGVRNLIVLDLASVGISSGIKTVELCQSLKEFAPNCRITTGGGIRSVNDLSSLAESGVDACLVASALHSGAITPDELRSF